MNIIRRIHNALSPYTHSRYLEILKGAIEGQRIRFSSPQRYLELKKIRPDRKMLVKQKKKAMLLFRQELKKKGLVPVQIFGRVKTLGSLDRKEKYVNLTHPDLKEEYLTEDLVGVSLVMSDKAECYAAAQTLAELGKFPTLTGRNNPRDYFQNPSYARNTHTMLIDLISGNLKLEGFSPIHVRIFTPESYHQSQHNREGYVHEINERLIQDRIKLRERRA